MGIYIGTSGWSYDHWTNVLYPPDTPQRERLAVYVQRYPTVEVNSTFYHWPPDATFAYWRRRVPPWFLLSVKAPRGLTHGKRLWQPERWIEHVTRGLRPLGDRLGVLLVQLPPAMEYDYTRLEYFLATATAPYSRRAGAAPPELAARGYLGSARAIPGGLLCHERCRAAMYSARDSAVCVCPAARSRPRAPIRRLV